MGQLFKFSLSELKGLFDRNNGKLQQMLMIWFTGKIVRTAASVVFILLLIVLAYSSAKLFWSFFPEYVNKTVNTTNQPTNERVERNYLDEIFNSKIFPASLEKIRDFNKRVSHGSANGLMARPNTNSNTPVVTQPVRPNIKITGILASDKPDKSIVILQYNNDENVYSEGEQLTGSAIRIAKIFEDRIEVLSADRKETYTYYMELSETDRIKLLKENTRRGNTSQRVNTTPNTVVNNNSSNVITTTAPNTTSTPVVTSTPVNVNNEPKENAPRNNANMRDQGFNPLAVGQSTNQTSTSVKNSVGTSIQDYVNISPVENEQGTGVKGYRLNPGKKPELFTKSGFRPNDLAIRVNGFDLTDPTQTRQLFSEFSTTKNFEITVERDGIPENIYINIGDSNLPNTTNTGDNLR